MSQRIAGPRPDLPSFRVLPHGHTHPDNGGALDSVILGGGGGSGGGSGSGVPLEVTDGTHTVTPATILDFTAGAVVTDLGGGVAGVAVTNAELNIEGGQSVIKAHGSLGATATFDPTDGNVHTGTLTANCTVTLTAPTGSGACTLEGWVTEDGTGGRTVAFVGWSVTVQGAHDTTAGTTSRFIAESIDGGTTGVVTWLVTSVGLTMPAEFTVTGSPVTSTGTLAVTKANASANLVYAGPASGAAAAPTFRALVAADMPAGVGAPTEAGVYGVGGHWEVLMDPATSSPPVPLTTPDGTDWVYGWLSDGG